MSYRPPSPTRALRALAPSLVFTAACFVGNAPPVVAPEPSEDIDTKIQAKAEAQAPGAERVGELLRGIGKSEGAFAEFKVPLQKGACYAFIGAGDATVSALSLTVWDKNTFRAGQDLSDGREAFVEVCAEQTAEYQVQGKIGAGAGHFAVGVFRKSGGSDADDPASGPPVANEADIEKAIKEDAKTAAADNKQLGAFYAATSSKNDWYVELQRDVCYWFIARGTQDADFKMTLWDGRNGRIEQVDASGGRAQLAHCAGEKNMYHVQVKVSGEAAVKLGVFSSASKTGGGGKVDADLEKTIRADAAAAAPGARQVGGFHTATGKKTNFFVQLEEGRCYWIIAAGSAETDDYTLYAWGPDSRRVAENRDIKQKGQIGHCAQESGMFKFEVKLDDPSDTVAVGVFGK